MYIAYSVLDLAWDRREDTFSISPISWKKVSLEKITKRTLLYMAHRAFDSIGFTCVENNHYQTESLFTLFRRFLRLCEIYHDVIGTLTNLLKWSIILLVYYPCSYPIIIL